MRTTYTITVMTRPRPLTMTSDYYFAKGSALALARAAGEPVYLTWTDDLGYHSEETRPNGKSTILANGEPLEGRPCAR